MKLDPDKLDPDLAAALTRAKGKGEPTRKQRPPRARKAGRGGEHSIAGHSDLKGAAGIHMPCPPGDVMLRQVYDFLGRFVAYPSEHAHVAHTLWVVHAH